MPSEAFNKMRAAYPVFIYKNYQLFSDNDFINIVFDFEIDGLCEFHPSLKIQKSNIDIVNDFNSPVAENIIFNLGMVELISYWKCACPKTVKIECGHLPAQAIAFWKQLYFGGLSEFFYTNDIKTDFDSFMTIVSLPEESLEKDCGCHDEYKYISKGINLIPIGGGKDSAVTAQLLKPFGAKNKFFTVNEQLARTQTVLAAGYCKDDIVHTFRTIDKNLLTLNSQGFLNGHTPFSAIVAFLSLYCAYLIGGNYIVLSNESSANESNIEGTQVNHQYSKSYQFENDFTDYVRNYIVNGIEYFSMLRPFSELQIAKMFSKLPQYHKVFRSCNRGSSKNVWCQKCAKCLFVYSILAPFLPVEKMIEIFGSEMLDDKELVGIFDGLVGFSSVKPFECVGTVSEISFALLQLCERYKKVQKELPYLLKHFYDKADKSLLDNNLLNEYNPLNNVPNDFLFAVKEMFLNVADNG